MSTDTPALADTVNKVTDAIYVTEAQGAAGEPDCGTESSIQQLGPEKKLRADGHPCSMKLV